MTTAFKLQSGDSLYIEGKYLESLYQILHKIGLSDTLKKNVWKIPQGRVGKIVAEDFEITVLPSIYYLSAVDYLRLILYNEYEPKGIDDLLGWQKVENLSDVVISFFLDKLEKLSQVGIPRKYYTFSSYNSFQTGITNYEVTYERYLLQNKPEFLNHSDCLSIDYPIVKIIKAAYIKVVRQRPIYYKPHISKMLRDVAEVKISDSFISRIETYPCRTMVGLNQTFEMAKLILLDMNLDTGFDSGSMSLLINANDVFEKYVAKLLKAYFSREVIEYHENKKVSARSSTGKELESEPDILLKGARKIIIDVKNKNIDDFVSSSDFYQMVCYCKCFNAETAILIYPDCTDRETSLLIPEFDKSIKIHVVSIDITKTTYSENHRAILSLGQKIDNIMRFG